MRTFMAIGGLLLAGTAVGMAAETKVLTPADVERDRPEGVVTVRFQVGKVGFLTGVIPVGQPPHDPIMLESDAKLKDPRNKLYVVLVSKALEHVHQLAIDVTKHFEGRMIEATGKVSSISLPRITRPDGTVEIPADQFTHYEIVIDSLDDLRVVE